MKPHICINCRWCLPEIAPGVHYCQASQTTNLVTGEPEYKYCLVMRQDEKLCGKMGTLWCPKLPNTEADNE
jgi:hypothetical protein